MIYQHKHRIIEELEKRREKGEIIHFLTGDSTNDNFFYDIRQGVLSIADTLKQYYILDSEQTFDYFLHIVNSNNNLRCYARIQNKISPISFDDMFPDPEMDSPLVLGGASVSNAVKEGSNTAKNIGSDITNRIEKLNELLKLGEKRIFVFLENLEWIANLYGEQPDHIWIATMKRWSKYRNLQFVVTIKDMELLKKYSFSQEEIFLGMPSALEIKYAYFRHILRNTSSKYLFDMEVLDEIAHRLSAGGKSLCACMRILRKTLRQNSVKLNLNDFAKGFDTMIEEKVGWDNVRLEPKIKERIKKATEAFLQDGSRPARKGIIFTGPPGTGKTLIAKALANEAKCYFMAPTLADLKGEYIGESSAKVKRIFAEARGNAPTIIFIDEADTVFPSRSLGMGDRDSFSLDMVNQFLQELDGAQNGQQKIFTIAATNRFEAIDPAIKSRLSGEPINIPLPSKEMRRLIFDDNLSIQGKVFSLQGKIFEDKVLERSENMSGRDIMNFVKKLHEEVTELKNDTTTENAFMKLFAAKENSFLDELAAQGIFSRDNIISPKENNYKLNSIIGYDDLKEKIRLQVDYIRADKKQKKQYDVFGIEPRKGILLYGPPGNGKSALAKAVAGEYGFYFFKVLSRDFANSYPDEQIKKLERIFTEVTRFSKMMTNCPGIVLFFDEFDSLAGVNILNTVVRGSLLNYIADEKGLRSKDSRILFMAATNFPERIDEAMKRQGRIDTHLFMDNPTHIDGEKMLQVFFELDPAPIHITSDLIAKAYHCLCDEKDDNVFNAYIKEHREDYRFLKEHDRKDLREVIVQDVRPSGAEIETLYRELKEIAFSQKHNETNELIIDDRALSHRFKEGLYNE